MSTCKYLAKNRFNGYYVALPFVVENDGVVTGIRRQIFIASILNKSLFKKPITFIDKATDNNVDCFSFQMILFITFHIISGTYTFLPK